MNHSTHTHAAADAVIDPVCGMTVDPAKSPHRHDYRHATYRFCSAGCRSKFAADPQKYLGDTDPAADIINYNAQVLGRQGYVSILLVTSLASIGSEKAIADTLAADTHFDSGRRYADCSCYS